MGANTTDITATPKPPFIRPPVNDKFRESTTRIQLALSAGDYLKNTMQATLNGDSSSIPAGGALDPFKGKKAAVIAALTRKIAPFADITDRLSRAGNDLRALELELVTAEQNFSRIDISEKPQQKPSPLRIALTTGAITKDSDKQYKVAQLADRSSKTSAKLTALRQALSTLKPKLNAREEVKQGATPASIVVHKNKEIMEACRSPAQTVHNSVPKKLNARLHHELEEPIMAIRKELNTLHKGISLQMAEISALVPDQVKQDIKLNLSRPGD